MNVLKNPAEGKHMLLIKRITPAIVQIIRFSLFSRKLIQLIVLLALCTCLCTQAQELTWTSPNARIPFSSYEEGCAHSIANYCSFVPSSGCISASPGAFGYYHNGGRPYATCVGTATFEYMDGDIRKTRTMTDILDAVYSAPVGYVLTDPLDNPPLQQCAGNPIEVGTGMKVQQEEDVPARGIGQISFSRAYTYRIASAQAIWRNNYQNSLQLLTSLNTDSYRFKSPQYPGKASACLSGWQNIRANITAGWAVNATATHDGDICKIKVNGTTVRNMAVVKNVFISASAESNSINLLRFNGVVHSYVKNGANWYSLDGTAGVLERVNSGNVVWRYQNGATIEEYSATGKLISISANNGMKQELFYDATGGLLSRVKDSTGRELLFAYTGNQLSSLTVDGNKTTSYTYNAAGLITQVTRPDNTTRVYHYEDTRFPTALTGITDERGARYATWTYDAQGRAISSEHAGGAEKTLLAFNADGSTTVTNALNKQTIYRFADIAGARRVTKVEGQPTANCIGANQDYTYTPEGWIASKTDWKGIKTTFTYNAAGQEISRTEAFGTPEARTTTTEWHPTLFVKTKITEPEKETIYSYDINGRLVNQLIQSITVQ